VPFVPTVGYQEREVFEAFLALPAPQKKIVREVIQTFAKAYPAEPEGQPHSAKNS
jgi:hypothetical protein